MTRFTKKEVEANVNEFLRFLDSGEFEQTKYTLRRGNGYCCLGLATEKVGKIEPSLADSMTLTYEYDENQETLPDKVKNMLGFNDNVGGCHTEEEGNSNLAEQNDDYRLSFPEIADVIRSQPKGLFKFKTRLKLNPRKEVSELPQTDADTQTQ